MNQIANDMLADEDMNFLNQIARSLAQQYPQFRINLDAGVCITNTGAQMFTFTGLDQIKEAHTKIVQFNNVMGQRYQLLMPTTTLQKEKIGEMFGMDIIADPTCPADKFLIQPVL